MKNHFLILFLLISILGNAAFAQEDEEDHGDIEIGYSGGAIIFEADHFTNEGIALFESEFDISFGDTQTDEPGFDTIAGNVIPDNHQVFLRILDANADSATDIGEGYLNFFDPDDNLIHSSGDLRIFRETASPVDPLFLTDGDYDMGSLTQLVDVADEGEIHGHVVFDLLNDSEDEEGAFGMLFQLESYFDGFDGSAPDLVSDKFWIVVNNGMIEEDFETRALPAFGIAAVPEPTSAVLLLAGIAGLGMKRRRVA